MSCVSHVLHLHCTAASSAAEYHGTGRRRKAAYVTRYESARVRPVAIASRVAPAVRAGQNASGRRPVWCLTVKSGGRAAVAAGRLPILRKPRGPRWARRAQRRVRLGMRHEVLRVERPEQERVGYGGEQGVADGGNGSRFDLARSAWWIGSSSSSRSSSSATALATSALPRLPPGLLLLLPLLLLFARDRRGRCRSNRCPRGPRRSHDWLQRPAARRPAARASTCCRSSAMRCWTRAVGSHGDEGRPSSARRAREEALVVRLQLSHATSARCCTTGGRAATSSTRLPAAAAAAAGTSGVGGC